MILRKLRERKRGKLQLIKEALLTHFSDIPADLSCG